MRIESMAKSNNGFKIKTDKNNIAWLAILLINKLIDGRTDLFLTGGFWFKKPLLIQSSKIIELKNYIKAKKSHKEPGKTDQTIVSAEAIRKKYLSKICPQGYLALGRKIGGIK